MAGRDSDVANFQDLAHPADHDYSFGSPHLTHMSLHRWMVEYTVKKVLNTEPASGQLRVLEIGAGHGAFTDHVLAAGAAVTITEMSRASADLLRARYARNDSAQVLHDPAGDLTALAGERFDLVLCVAVLHHIPDYLGAITEWVNFIEPGGGFLSFQDPLWYPRQGRMRVAVHRGAHFAWRLTQGDLVEGAKSLTRRMRGAMDESNPRDMVEYHVIRSGCDEVAIAELLKRHFASVTVLPYWSTTARPMQTLGERWNLTSNFGIDATGKSA